MGQCTIMVWSNNPSQSLDLNNIDHAAIRMDLTSPANANRYNCVARAVYTSDLALSPFPVPVGIAGGNQVNLSGNNFSVNPNPNRMPSTPIQLSGLTTQGLSGVLGASSFRLIIDNKEGIGDSNTDRHAANIINMISGRGGRFTTELAEVSNYYNDNAMPVCFYIVLRAISPSCNDLKPVI